MIMRGVAKINYKPKPTLKTRVEAVITKLEEKRFGKHDLPYPAMAAFDMAIDLLKEALK